MSDVICGNESDDKIDSGATLRGALFGQEIKKHADHAKHDLQEQVAAKKTSHT